MSARPTVVRVSAAHPLSYEPLPGATGMELARVITDSDVTHFGGGYAQFPTDGEFADWTLAYDEVFYVLEGRFEVEHDGRTHEGAPGDILLLEKGTTVTYRGSAGTRVFFVLHPRNWADG